MFAVRPSFFVVGMGVPVALLAPAHASAQQIQFDQLRGMVPADADRSRCCVVLDADRDSDLDLLLVNGSVTPRLYLNDGQGTFADGTEGAFSGPSGFSMSCAAGDVDGDGILDLVFANAYSSNSLFLGDGRGRFVDATTGRLPSDLDATQAVALGDLDGDGDLDIVWGNGEDWVRRQQNRIYLNLGRGVFVDATPGSLPVWGDATLGIALGDLDRDGDLDLLFANDGRNRLLLNDGAAVFSDVTIANLPPDAETSFSISLGDVDADGDLDAMVGNGRWTPEPSRLYLNDGFARFSDATAALLDAPPGLCRATLLADLDGDGDLDGWLGNFGQDLALGNDGHGRLSPAGFPDPPPDPADTPWVANGDVDGDGDLDLILARFGQTRLLLNRGDGAFTDVTLPDLPADSGWGQSCLLHDLDGDGYPRPGRRERRPGSPLSESGRRRLRRPHPSFLPPRRNDDLGNGGGRCRR